MSAQAAVSAALLDMRIAARGWNARKRLLMPINSKFYPTFSPGALPTSTWSTPLLRAPLRTASKPTRGVPGRRRAMLAMPVASCSQDVPPAFWLFYITSSQDAARLPAKFTIPCPLPLPQDQGLCQRWGEKGAPAKGGQD